MPAYKYEALYPGGERVSGVLEAVSENAAVAQIRQSCEVVLSLEEVKTGRGDPLGKLRKVDVKELSLVCRQFSIILKAGLPLVQTVDLVSAQVSDKTLKKILRQVSEDVSNGRSLSYSIAQRGGRKLPLTFVETVRAGEESGDLVRAFERMSSYYERLYKTKAKATSALLYPAFVIAVAVIVVAIIMVYAVPTFSSTFDGMGIELPLMTRVLIGVSNFMAEYIWLIVAVIALLILLVRLYGHTDSGAQRLARWKLGIPVVGKINLMAGASQFAHTMSVMMASGLPILQALDVSGHTMTNACLSREILNTIPGVESGSSLGECMSRCPDLPDLLVQMTAMGEATGSMESTLEILAEFYDNEVDDKTARALSLLEPIIICMLAFVVLGILLAVYLPLFGMYGAI